MLRVGPGVRLGVGLGDAGGREDEAAAGFGLSARGVNLVGLRRVQVEHGRDRAVELATQRLAQQQHAALRPLALAARLAPTLGGPPRAASRRGAARCGRVGWGHVDERERQRHLRGVG